MATVELTSTYGGTPACRGETLPDEGVAKAFDGTSSTKWLDSNSTSWAVWQFDDDEQYVCNGYSLTSANDHDERDPEAWTLYGSNDGSTWTALDSQVMQSFSARYQKQYWYFLNTTAYEYYKLDIAQVNGGSSFQISQIEFLYVMAAADLIKVSQVVSETEYDVPGKVTLSQLAAETEYDVPGKILISQFFVEVEYTVTAGDEDQGGLFFCHG